MLRNDVARGARAATRQTARRTRRSRRPAANAEAGPSSQRLSSVEWDAQLDPSGPTFELLYGGSSSSSEFHDARRVALMWCSELSCAECAALAANRHLVFTRQALTEALGRCYTASPSARGSQSGPSSASGDKGKGKGKGRADYKVVGKRKGRADPPAEPMDKDGDDDADDGEDAAGDSAGAESPAWGGF